MSITLRNKIAVRCSQREDCKLVNESASANQGVRKQSNLTSPTQAWLFLRLRMTITVFIIARRWQKVEKHIPFLVKSEPAVIASKDLLETQ